MGFGDNFRLFALALACATGCSLFPDTPPVVDAGAAGGSAGIGGNGGSAGSGGTAGNAGATGGVAGSCTSSDTVELDADADTYLLTPQTSSTHGGETILELAPNGSRRALVRFQLPGNLDPGVLVNASLDLTVSDNVSFDETIVAHRVTQTWDETLASWVTAEAAVPWGQQGGEFDAIGSAAATITSATVAGRVVSFDVTDDVAAFLLGTQVNQGWLIKVNAQLGSNSDRLRLASKEVASQGDRPRLVLTLCD